MRTTLTIDDDLIREMKKKAQDSGSPFKRIVNAALRAGLKEMDKSRISRPYKCKAYSLGYPPLADLDHALDLVDQFESEEIIRKLSLRK
ncbi:MAG: DUF2191 domain-containing protein [Thermodesulfobacteriota bacterium]